MAFNGLKALMALKLLILYDPGKKLVIEVITTKKSIIFHPFFKYVFFPKINPILIILSKNSSIKIIEK